MDDILRLPRLNEPAPAFEANTTHGMRKLADHKDKWPIPFSHPADFTPVCTTEFPGFAKAYSEFQKLNCELLGLSIDSVYSHIAWTRSIKQNFDVDIPFPIVDDLSQHIGRPSNVFHRRQEYLASDGVLPDEQRTFHCRVRSSGHRDAVVRCERYRDAPSPAAGREGDRSGTADGSGRRSTRR